MPLTLQDLGAAAPTTPPPIQGTDIDQPAAPIVGTGRKLEPKPAPVGITLESLGAGKSAPGRAPAAAPRPGGGITLEDLGGGRKTGKEAERGTDQPAVDVTPGFWDHLLRVTGNAALQLMQDPRSVEIGAVKGTVAGLGQMGSLAVQGIAGLATAGVMDDAARARGATQAERGAAWAKGFETGQTFAEKSLNKAAAYVTAVNNINLAPANKGEEAAINFLNLLPEGVNALGDTVYEKTGSAVLGAGTQTLATLLLLKPGIAGRMLEVVPKFPKAKADFVAAAASDPELVKRVIDHVPKDQEALKDELMKDYTGAQKGGKGARQQIGRQVANPGETTTYHESEKGPVTVRGGQGGVLMGTLTPEKDTVRIGVAILPESERGQGFGVGMLQRMVDENLAKKRKIESGHEVTEEQQHVYAALGRRGYTIQQHPAKRVSGLSVDGKPTTMLVAVDEEGPQGGPVFTITGRKPGVKPTKRYRTQTAAEALAELDRPAAEPSVERKPAPITKPPGAAKEPPKAAKAAPTRGPGARKEAEAMARGAAAQRRVLIRRGMSPEEADKAIAAAGTGAPGQRFVPTGRVSPSGKPIIRPMSPEQVSALSRESARRASDALDKPPSPPPGVEDPVVLKDGEGTIKRSELDNAIKKRDPECSVCRLPGQDVVEGYLKGWAEAYIKTFAPEMLGRDAQLAASTIQKARWTEMQRASMRFHTSGERRRFWNGRMADAPRFMRLLDERKPGEMSADERELAEQYRSRMQQTNLEDTRAGFTNLKDDHYLPHLFENPEEVERWLNKNKGKNWEGATYTELVRAGMKPKYANPEDIMAAREHASDVMHTKATILRDLESLGLAVRLEKGIEPPESGFSHNVRTSPTGERYRLTHNAEHLYKQGLESKSLWSDFGKVSEVFRGFMHAKNSIIPIRLISLFHVLHESLGLDNANAMLAIDKDMLTGKINPVQWFMRQANAAIPLWHSLVTNLMKGHPILSAFRGTLPANKWTPMIRQALWLMHEGGLTPELPREFTTNAIQRFKDALQQRKALGTVFWAPFAMIQWTMTPMFEHWIPSLKIAAYLKQAAQAIDLNPDLMRDPGERQLTLARIRKGIDERYGEMSYNAMFWPRWLKDLGVLNTLSLAWQMGVLKQFGGAPYDLLTFAGKKAPPPRLTAAQLPPGETPARPMGPMQRKVARGDLDKPLFALRYMALGFMYTGAFQYMMTGEQPHGIDWFWPRVGGTGPDGKPNRVGTVFFHREFASWYLHVRNSGLVTGLTDVVRSKASGVIGLTAEAIRGVNGFGQEIRDENSPIYKQVGQTLHAMLSDIEPIAEQSIEKGTGSFGFNKETALAFAGLTHAPRYVTDSPTEAHISELFRKYHTMNLTSYEQAQYSEQYRDMRHQYAADDPRWEDTLDKMTKQFKLTTGNRRQIIHSLESTVTPMQRMFSKLTWKEQIRVLDRMNPTEREEYLPHADKKRVRNQYVAPEERTPEDEE